jgi:hypothetical protein
MAISNRLFDSQDYAPPAVRPKRQRNHACQYLYVRRVKGFKYQARVWLPMPLGSINLGLYNSEREAWMAFKAWLKAGGDPVKGLPAGVLPKWVRRTTRSRFLGRLRTLEGVVLVGPFATAEDAHRAVRASFEVRPAPVPVPARCFQPTLCGLA